MSHIISYLFHFNVCIINLLERISRRRLEHFCGRDRHRQPASQPTPSIKNTTRENRSEFQKLGTSSGWLKGRLLGENLKVSVSTVWVAVWVLPGRASHTEGFCSNFGKLASQLAQQYRANARALLFRGKCEARDRRRLCYLSTIMCLEGNRCCF